jgi:inorganic pyrophosphatase
MNLRSVKDINAHLLHDLERFFVNYNETHGKKVRLVGTRGVREAMKLLKSASSS